MAALQYLCPQFLKENRLYWLRTPLFKVSNGKNVKYYYSDEEFNKVRQGLKGEVIRYKGLGQLEPDDLKRSMFSPTEQKLELMEYSEEAIELLTQLMGESVLPRKEFIFNNIDFSKYGEV